MAAQDVVLLVIVVAVAVMALYWYQKHRQIDALLRRYEGEHYGRAKSRLTAVLGRKHDPAGADGHDPAHALDGHGQRRMRGLIGDTPAPRKDRHAAHR